MSLLLSIKYKDGFNRDEQWFYNPIIVVDIHVNGRSLIQIHFPQHNEEELKKSIESFQEILTLYDEESLVAFKFSYGKWVKTTKELKNHKQTQNEIFKQYNSEIQNTKVKVTENVPSKPVNLGVCLRLVLVLSFIFLGSALITEKLTPPDYAIRFKRECDGVQCKKIKNVDSERSATIEREIGELSSILERVDFFARLTFLRFDFQTTNQTQFIFSVTEPKYEKGIDITMQCNLNGQNYTFFPNSGITFKQQSSFENIIRELNKVQNVLINCNPAPQNIQNMIKKPVEVAPEARVQLIFQEEKYRLRFLPDRWNYPLTVLQVSVMIGILFAAYHEIARFIKEGLKR